MLDSTAERISLKLSSPSGSSRAVICLSAASGNIFPARTFSSVSIALLKFRTLVSKDLTYPGAIRASEELYASIAAVARFISGSNGFSLGMYFCRRRGDSAITVSVKSLSTSASSKEITLPDGLSLASGVTVAGLSLFRAPALLAGFPSAPSPSVSGALGCLVAVVVARTGFPLPASAVPTLAPAPARPVSAGLFALGVSFLAGLPPSTAPRGPNISPCLDRPPNACIAKVSTASFVAGLTLGFSRTRPKMLAITGCCVGSDMSMLSNCL